METIADHRWKKYFIIILLLTALLMQIFIKEETPFRIETKNFEIIKNEERISADFQKYRVAWWGTLYPAFCFGKIAEKKDGDNIRIHPKISFYLAKLLDW